MDIENALLSFLTQSRDLITDNRPLRLRLDHPTGMLEDVLLPQRVTGSEAICGGLEYRVLCVSLDAHLPLKELIALPAAIDIVTDTGDLRTVCGIVTEAMAGDSDGGLASYQLLVQDALAVMEKRTNTRVFRNMNEVDIVCTLLDEWRRTNAVIAACFEYEMDELFKLQEYPRREFTMQYNESDAAFIRRLLRRRGICWTFLPCDGKLAHKIVLFNHADSLPMSPAGAVRFHRDAATEESDTITSWTAVRKLTPASVTIFSSDYMGPNDGHFSSTESRTSLADATSGQELRATLDDYTITSPHLADSFEDLVSLGRLSIKRRDLESKSFHGEGSVRAFRAGEYFLFENHPEVEEHPVEEREFVLTGLQLASENNLPKELMDRIDGLFMRSGWEASLYKRMALRGTRTKVRFQCVRRCVEIVPSFDLRADTPTARAQTAIVVGPKGEVVHTDGLGRVKVRFQGMREADHRHADGAGASDTDGDSAWIRVASCWAGPAQDAASQNGALLLPRVGSEVLIDFLHGDPDKPVIVGQLFNIQTETPQFVRSGALPETRYISGLRSYEIDGGRCNQLRFDDTTNQINTQLASEHGASQLNLGYLVNSAAGMTRSRRGEGVELRTDQHVAVRGAEGVLVTAEASTAAHLQMDEFLRVCKAIARVGEELFDVAKTYDGQATARPALHQLIALIEEMEKRAASTVAISAPAGMLYASGGSAAMVAEDDSAFLSGKSTVLEAGDAIDIRAGKGLHLFSNEAGAALTAASGRVRLSAEQANVELVARRVLDIISNADWINIKAKHGVRINGGGSEIELSQSGIRQYTSGSHLVHAADHQALDGQSKPLQFAGELPPHKICVRCVEIAARSHSPFAAAG